MQQYTVQKLTVRYKKRHKTKLRRNIDFDFRKLNLWLYTLQFLNLLNN